MRFARLLFQRFQFTKHIFGPEANEWIQSTWGRRFRITVLGFTVVGYPISYVFINGPLLRKTFKKRHDVDTEIPSHLKQIIEEEYTRWLENEGRKKKDAVVEFYLQKQFENIDTFGTGSLSVRFGAHIALPLFARFQNVEEAKQYCEKHLEPLKVFDIPVCIIWDSKFGNELLQTFVLSKNALRFLVYRDLLSRDGYQAFANKAISWATFTTFSSLLTYWWHQRKPKPTAKAFFLWYAIFTACAVFAAVEWHKGHLYIVNSHADLTASRLSSEFSLGGIEYYMKLLKRNQLLRAVIDNGHQLFTPAGDQLGAAIPYLTRYTVLREAKLEHSELAPSIEGDVF